MTVKEEKLIELLNGYTKQSYDDYSFFKYIEPTHSFYISDDGYESYISEEVILSKRFGFISWLVENDKIDFESQAIKYVKSDLSKFFAEREDINWMSDDCAMLLMLLAIQDEPIGFLCEILK